MQWGRSRFASPYSTDFPVETGGIFSRAKPLGRLARFRYPKSYFAEALASDRWGLRSVHARGA